MNQNEEPKKAKSEDEIVQMFAFMPIIEEFMNKLSESHQHASFLCIFMLCDLVTM